MTETVGAMETVKGQYAGSAESLQRSLCFHKKNRLIAELVFAVNGCVSNSHCYMLYTYLQSLLFLMLVCNKLNKNKKIMYSTKRDII